MNENSKLNWSRHASQRASQRAIRQPAIDAALSWGSEVHQPGGRTALCIDRAAIERARVEGVDIECWAGMTLILGPDGGAITTVRSPDLRRLRTFGATRGNGRRARP